ncbi:MAG: hypothetical protein QW046_04215 [Candidatus Micrarchaeaceae archaeon]
MTDNVVNHTSNHTPDHSIEHIFVVTLEDCPICKETKKDLAEITDNVEFVDMNSDKGREIQKQLVINKVPTCVIGIEDINGMKYDYCDHIEKQKQFD